MSEVLRYQPELDKATDETDTGDHERLKIAAIVGALGGYAGFKHWLTKGAAFAGAREIEIEMSEPPIERDLLEELKAILRETNSENLEPNTKAYPAVVKKILPAMMQTKRVAV